MLYIFFYHHMNSISMSYHVRTEFTTVVTIGRYQIGSESNLQVLYNNLRFMNLKCHFIPSFININDHPTSLSLPLHLYMNMFIKQVPNGIHSPRKRQSDLPCKWKLEFATTLLHTNTMSTSLPWGSTFKLNWIKYKCLG